MKKALIIAATTIALTGVSYSKELNLECVYTNSDKKMIKNIININTASGTAGLTNNGTSSFSKKLYSDSSHYWFTASAPMGSGMILAVKRSIDRNTLKYNETMTMLGTVDGTKEIGVVDGQCKLIEIKTKI